ncbi:MAG: HAD family hydrolase [Methanomicrobiaceae archaeon]|nr:HAD family hydrolase [Methanomicrobiaceae archaeon]
MKIIKTIILDFDGVIVESDNIKHRAFSEIFSEYPDFYNEIMDYHYSHNAVDRYDKFRHIMTGIMKTGYDETLFKEWSERFRNLTTDAIIKCPFVPGALDFLEYFSGITPLHLASATPGGDLMTILEKKGLSRYFSSANGSDRPKTEILQSVADSEHTLPEEMLYIGDSPEDLKTAENYGCRFIGRQRQYDFKKAGIVSFPDLYGIKGYILENYIFEKV